MVRGAEPVIGAAAAAAARARRAGIDDDEPSLRDVRVLVIDDERTILEGLAGGAHELGRRGDGRADPQRGAGPGRRLGASRPTWW